MSRVGAVGYTTMIVLLLLSASVSAVAGTRAVQGHADAVIVELSAQRIGEQEGLVISGQGLSPAVCETYLLLDPPRLVLDMQGVQLKGKSVQGVTDLPFIKGCRSKQYPGFARVVIDLKDVTGYRVVSCPGGLCVLLNHRITGVEWMPASSETGIPAVGQLLIGCSGMAPYRVNRLHEPERIVIDVSDSTLVGPARVHEVDDDVVKQVRISQFDPATVRVVLDVNYVLEVSGGSRQKTGDTNILLDFFYRLDRITAVNRGLTTEISLGVTGPVRPEVQFFENPYRLVVDLPHTVPGMSRLQEVIPGVEDARLGQFEPGLTRVVFEMPVYSHYRLQPARTGTGTRIVLERAPGAGKTVVIDPGHGGRDPGTAGCTGTLEKDINLDIALRLGRMLERYGTRVLYTRKTDRYVGLLNRVSNHQGVPELFLSIHANSSPSRDACGTESFYLSTNYHARYLAHFIQKEVTARVGTVDRGIKANHSFYVLRANQIPSLLLEVGFLSNPAEEQKLKDPGFRQRLAEGIFIGIQRYLAWEMDVPLDRDFVRAFLFLQEGTGSEQEPAWSEIVREIKSTGRFGQRQSQVYQSTDMAGTYLSATSGRCGCFSAGGSSPALVAGTGPVQEAADATRVAYQSSIHGSGGDSRSVYAGRGAGEKSDEPGLLSPEDGIESVTEGEGASPVYQCGSLTKRRQFIINSVK